MSNSDTTSEEARAQVSSDRRNMIGMLRVMAITVTSKSFWQVVGILLIDGVTKEGHEVATFPGIGFFARPKPGAKTQGFVAFAGGAENPCLIATRDEDTRRRVAAIDQDETIAFNSVAALHITKAGQVHARAVGGAAVELAKASELNDLRAFVHAQFSGVGHVHGGPGGATTSTAPVGVAPAADYAGTSVLKGQ